MENQIIRCPISKHKINKDHQILCLDCFQTREEDHQDYQMKFEKMMREKKESHSEQINEFLREAQNMEELRINQLQLIERVKSLKNTTKQYTLNIQQLKESIEQQRNIVFQLKQRTEDNAKIIIRNQQEIHDREEAVKKLKFKVAEKRRILISGCIILYDSISSFPNLCFFQDEIRQSKFDVFEPDVNQLLETVIINGASFSDEFIREYEIILSLKKNLTLQDDQSYSKPHQYNFIAALKNSLWMLYRLMQIFDVTPPYLMDVTEISRTTLVTLRHFELWNKFLCFKDNHLIKLLLNFYYFAYHVGINIDHLIKTDKFFDFESLLSLLNKEEGRGYRRLILPIQLAKIDEIKFSLKAKQQIEQNNDEDFIIIE